MSLYNKYRPQTLDEIRGNTTLVATLKKMLENKTTCPHVFLFHGATGTGKTTLARIVARELDIKGYDLQEINSADFRGIDTVRDVIRSSQFMPLESKSRMWIIDEVQKLTNDAQSALLKILEDTPPHVYFALCTTEPQKILDTIRGRCQQFQTSPLTEREMYGLLRHIVHSEQEELTRDVYDQIILDSMGLPRNAIQILEQVLNVPGEQRLEVARKTAERQSQSIELCRALINNSSWKEVSRILSGLKDQDAESIRRHVMKYCEAVLLKGENDRAGLVLEQFWDPFFNTGFSGLVYSCYAIVRK
ncbi:MAG TPA: AAA family ATPase [Paludibacteraceae bacterium]|nr:AAA family ATPase [Paludibacteraceae bacterium]